MPGAKILSNRHGLVIALLSVHGCLLAWEAARDSPGWDEVGHLVAGISHWRLGTFDLYPVNPPLVRMVAVVPVLTVGANVNWRLYSAGPGARSEREIRDDFSLENADRFFWLHCLARWACIPFSVLGGTSAFSGPAVCTAKRPACWPSRCGAYRPIFSPTGT